MPQTHPLVSIITTFLDGQRFIRDAIDSVLAQTYDRWELLLVDDGSSDGSTAIAREYAARFPNHVRYVEHHGHANLGMNVSRNRGIEQATGDFLAFLDADDVWRREKLERQVTLLETHPAAAMVYGATEQWFSWTGRPSDANRDSRRTLGVPADTLVLPPTLPVKFLRREAQTPGMCGVLVRRSAALAVGGFNADSRSLYGDQVFLYKLCLRMPVFVESGSSDRYRQHAASATARARDTWLYSRSQIGRAHAHFLAWLDKYLIEEQITDAELRSALDAARARRRPSLGAWVTRRLLQMAARVRALGADRNRPGS